MSHSTKLRATRHGQLFFAAAFASAIGVGAIAAGCGTSPLGSGSPGTAGTGGGGVTGSGGTAGASGTAGAGGTAIGATGSGGTGSGCVATGRPTSTSCPQSVASQQQPCQSDTDCTGVSTFQGPGKCISSNGQLLCSYDTCFSDADCGARPAVCLCQGQWRVWSAVGPGNACRSGNCRDDSDCPGSVCSPSPAFGGSFYGWVGYYCHTPQDQCHCDADCSGANGYCDYNPEIAAWACANFGGAG